MEDEIVAKTVCSLEVVDSQRQLAPVKLAYFWKAPPDNVEAFIVDLVAKVFQCVSTYLLVFVEW